MEDSKDSECSACQGKEWVLSEDESGNLMARPCGCRERKRIERRLSFANIPKAFKNMRLDNFSLSAYKTSDGRNTAIAACRMIKHYMDDFENYQEAGMGLYLSSRTKGSGKTRMAASIANELVKKYPVKFAVGSEILSAIRSTYDNRDQRQMTESQLVSDISEVKILFIDDFGMDTASAWVNDRFYHIVNERYINKRVTFFTSNAAVENLKYDDRILNRVKGMTFQIPFPEESVRAQIAEERNNQLLREAMK